MYIKVRACPVGLPTLAFLSPKEVRLMMKHTLLLAALLLLRALLANAVPPPPTATPKPLWRRGNEGNLTLSYTSPRLNSSRYVVLDSLLLQSEHPKSLKARPLVPNDLSSAKTPPPTVTATQTPTTTSSTTAGSPSSSTAIGAPSPSPAWTFASATPTPRSRGRSATAKLSCLWAQSRMFGKRAPCRCL